MPRSSLVVPAEPGYRPAAVRHSLLGIAMLCLVGGSQYGMLILAGIYLTEDRGASRLSPEAVAGALGIALATMAIRARGSVRFKLDVTCVWLFAFLILAGLGEFLRPDVRLGNLSTFFSIGAFYLVGSAIGHDLREGSGKVPFMPLLLAVYTAWHVWLLLLMIKGDLGFYGDLPGSQLSRLEFRAGYTATELAIYLGLQLPILIYLVHATSAPLLKLWAFVLLSVTFSLIIATVSAAAIAATALVLAIFVVAKRGLSMRSLSIALVILCLLGAGSMLASRGLADSVSAKLQDFAFGEGARALIYAQLIVDVVENPALGIGKGRFVESNDLAESEQVIYPHQNFLGIAAELGVPAFLLFACFVASALVQFVRGLSRKRELPSSVRMVVVAALAVFAYQQFRGLFQDTWLVRETYLWLGMGLGALALVDTTPPVRIQR